MSVRRCWDVSSRILFDSPLRGVEVTWFSRADPQVDPVGRVVKEKETPKRTSHRCYFEEDQLVTQKSYHKSEAIARGNPTVCEEHDFECLRIPGLNDRDCSQLRVRSVIRFFVVL